jgi:hypothetical protein
MLHGLGGIGKTQLAIEFVSQHHRRYSAVFWLDGRSRDSVMQSIASYAGRILEGQISQSSKTYSSGSSGDIEAVVKEVIGWLAREDNDKWLLVFDNVDRDYGQHTSDHDAYDVNQYFAGKQHGSVLITTRLAKLEQLGDSWQLCKVNLGQAREILQCLYKRSHGKSWLHGVSDGRLIYLADPVGIDRLLSILDGLPLAIAAAFLQETGIEPQKYIAHYEQKWQDIMEPEE